MKRTVLLICLTVLLVLLVGCRPSAQPEGSVDATRYGVSADHGGEQNSIALQALIDELSIAGGTVYIPSGEYLFAANGTQTIGAHCIKMRSNVSIVGDGETTILKPVGESAYGLDMFYFNDYLDTGKPLYLKNCSFEDFVIDASGTSCSYYTSAGKGFMFNLFENCHWRKVTVKHTDATGFGVDCPIDSSISECAAIACGKAATKENTGASGFGIGFGYAENESLCITECTATDNKKFGFFFEHQGRFNDEKYDAVPENLFYVTDCRASGNLFGFGGVCTVNTVYENCRSEASLDSGFMFKDSRNSRAVDCVSANDGKASFAILQTATNGDFEVSGISYLRCRGKSAPIGLRVVSENPSARMDGNRAEDCVFEQTEKAVCTSGNMEELTLSGNRSDSNENSFLADVEAFHNFNNSWNRDPANLQSKTKENSYQKVKIK